MRPLCKAILWFVIKLADMNEVIGYRFQDGIYLLQRRLSRGDAVDKEIEDITRSVEDFMRGPQEVAESLTDDDKKRYGKMVELYLLLKESTAIFEAFSKALPLQIFNEMRNALDHIMRSLVSPEAAGDKEGTTRAAREEYQIQRAIGHVQRALLDSIKLVCSYLDSNITRRHSMVPPKALGLVDGGDYTKKITELTVLAHQKFTEAKRMDCHIGKEGANTSVIVAYLNALICHKKAYDYQSEWYGQIRWCGVKYLLVSAPGIVFGLVLGIICSLVAAMIFEALGLGSLTLQIKALF